MKLHVIRLPLQASTSLSCGLSFSLTSEVGLRRRLTSTRDANFLCLFALHLDTFLTGFAESALQHGPYVFFRMRESILITRNLISISGVIKRRPERAVMGVTHGFDAIDATTFDDVLGQYPDSVPEKLSDLDAQRYESIPDIVAARRPAPFLTKEEVATLVDWKL